MAKRKTNVKVVKDFMELNRYGALGQAFVIEALGRYAKQLDELTDEQIAELGNTMIDMKMFREVGREWIKVQKENY